MTSPDQHPLPPEAEVAPILNFNVEKRVEVAAEIEASAKMAIEDVWAHEVGTPSSVNLTFAGRIFQELDDGNKVSIASIYQPEDDRVTLGLDTISDNDGKLLSTEMLIAVYSAHEAQHKVQVHRGETPNPSHETMADGTYADDPHEMDAWDSAFRSLGRLYSDANTPLQSAHEHIVARHQKHNSSRHSRLRPAT